MQVLLNDNEVKIEIGETLNSLLKKKKLHSQKGIAIALNNTVIPKKDWADILLSSGDKITLIMATAGG